MLKYHSSFVRNGFTPRVIGWSTVMANMRPDGPISYAAFAEEVIAMLEKGLG